MRAILNWLAAFLTGARPVSAEEAPVLIIMGQGNPEPKYLGNRHNLGFMAVDRIAEDHGFTPWKSKFQAEICEGWIEGAGGRVKALLMKPKTYYNETGRAVAEAVRFYKLSAEDVTVFHDEIDLAPGRIRVKRGGGHSGNNGVRSVMSHLGAEIRRVRMGVGHPGDKSKVMPYVLSDFPRSETEWRDALLDAVSRALPYMAQGEDERFQTEVLRLAPAPKSDPRQTNQG